MVKRGDRRYVVLLVFALALSLFFATGPGGLTGLGGVDVAPDDISVSSLPVQQELEVQPLAAASQNDRGTGLFAREPLPSAPDGEGAGISSVTISTDITSCQNLAVADTYVLTQNVTSQSNCFNITADNIVLDCRGNTVLYANATEAAGIFVSAFNVSVINCRVEQINGSLGGSHGIRMSGADRSTIMNDTVITNGTLGGNPSNAIYLVGGTDHSLFTNNTFVALSQGSSVNVDSSVNNTFYRIVAYSNASGGFSFTSASTDNRVWDSYAQVVGANSGIAAAGVSDNLSIINGTFVGGTGSAISLISSGSHKLTNNTAQAPFGLQIINSANNVINATRVVSGTGIGVRFFGAGSTGNVLANITIATNNTWIFSDVASGSAQFTNTTFDSVFGAIEITPTATVPSGANVSVYSLNTSLNNSFLNSSNLTFLNLSGRFVLRNLSFIDPSPVVDFEDDGTFMNCTGAVCTEDSFSGGTYVVNVTHFTSYAATGALALTDCRNISLQGVNPLLNSVTAGGSCMNITSDNVTLDCQGFAIDYATLESGVGVSASGFTNVTVRNCVMRGGEFANSHGIAFTTILNGSIRNNTINTTGNPSSPIKLVSSVGADVSNNTVFVLNGTFSSSGSIYVTGGSANRIFDNIALSNGSSGLYFDGASSLNVVTNNYGVAQAAGSGVVLNPAFGTNFTNLTAISFSQPAILQLSSNGNVFTNAFLSSHGHIGFFAAASSFNVLENVTGLSNASQGMVFLNSGSSTVNNSRGAGGFVGLQLNGIGMGLSNFTNSNFSTNGTIAQASAVTIAGDAGSERFENVVLATNSSWIINSSAGPNTNFTNVTFLAAGNGTVRFPGAFTVNGSINQTNLRIGQNLAFLNSTNLTYLNMSAQIALNNITFSIPRMRVDFGDNGTSVLCDPSICLQDGYFGNTFVFNVSRFTTYSISDAAVTSCPITINESSALTQNISSNGTCITFGADDVDLDCQGHTITYGNTSVGYGINATGRINVFARNCIVSHGGTLVDSSAVFLSGTNQSLILNVTARANGSTSNGVELMSSHNNTIMGVTASSNDTGSGLRLQASHNNTVSNVSALAVSANAILSNGSGNSYAGVSGVATAGGTGINLLGGGGNVVRDSRVSSLTGSAIELTAEALSVVMNTSVNSSTGVGISLSGGAHNNTIVNNSALSAGAGGILLSTSSANLVLNNTAVGTSGIRVIFVSENNTIENNSAQGFGQFGIDLNTGPTANILRGNTGSSDTFAGIRLSAANANALIDNRAVGVGFSALFILASASNNLTGNNASSATSYGIEISGGGGNLLERNRATSGSEGGMYLTGGTTNNVLDNNTFQSDTAGAVEFGATGGQNNNFTNTTLTSNSSWIEIEQAGSTGNRFNNTFFDNGSASVRILGNFTLPDNTVVDFANLNVRFNRTFINSTNVSFLNQSAIITLRNLPFGSPRAMVDENDTGIFLECPSGRCTAISYSGGAFVFNVSGFTSFASAEGGGVAISKSDSPDPVVRGALLTYSILVNNSNNVSVFNVSVGETYPAGVAFVVSSPAPSAGNNTFLFPTLAANSSTSINITIRVGSNVANGTVLNNSANLTSQRANGSSSQANVSELTTVRGIPVLFTGKTDAPDPVPRGTTLAYQITVTNAGDEIAYNLTVIEGYPTNVAFNGSSPAPSAGNNTFSVGNLTPGASATINITVNASPALANASVLTNAYNLTFHNLTGASQQVSNGSQTSVLGSPNLSINKTDNPDPVFAGDQLVYSVTVNNTGDDTAFNVNVVDGYPAGVAFVTAQPNPIGNNTFVVGTLAPNAAFVINITVTVGGILPNGTVLNNTVNGTFTNRSGLNVTVNASQLTTVIGSPFVVTNKTANQTIVIKGTSVNYTIVVNNTGTSTAFNVTIREGYPAGTVFVSSLPPPTSGNGTFNVGTLQPNQSANVTIMLNVSAALLNGTILNNSYNTTLNRTDGRSVNATNSALVTVQGIPTLAVAKADSPDPILPGSQLNYTITITNTGDEIAYNLTLEEGYDPNVIFHNSSPVPSAGNSTFSIGNLSPGQSTTINITVNVSGTFLGVLNNTVNVTFANLSGQNATRNASTVTAVVAVIVAPPAGPGGGGGGSGQSSAVAQVTSMTGDRLSAYLRRNDKVRFRVADVDHVLTVREVLVDAVSIRVESVPQEFIIRKGVVQAVDVTGDGQADLRVSVSDVVYDRALFLLEKTTFSPAVKADYVAPDVRKGLEVPAAQVQEQQVEETVPLELRIPESSEIQGQALRPQDEQQRSTRGLFAVVLATMLALVIGISLYGRRDAPESSIPTVTILPPQDSPQVASPEVKPTPPTPARSFLQSIVKPKQRSDGLDLKSVDAELRQVKTRIKRFKK